MWRPRPIVLGLLPRPVLSGPKLGQLSQSLVDRAAKSVISEAEPRVREIIQEERSRLARAAIDGLPYMGAAATAFLATNYLVPVKDTIWKGVGYVSSAGLMTLGAWRAFEAAAGPEVPLPPPSEGSGIPFVQETAQQLAQAVVREAEPKVRAIVTEERERIGQAASETLPFFGASAAAFLATAYLAPDDAKNWKMAGYLTSAVAFLLGAWRGLSVVSDER